MQRTISVYKNVLIKKIMKSKTHFEVLGIIDTKIKVIDQKEWTKELKTEFIANVIDKLKKVDATKIQPGQWSNIRVAIGHLRNLRLP